MTTKLFARLENPMKLTAHGASPHWMTIVRHIVFLVAITVLLCGCSVFAKEYRDVPLALSFEYPSSWDIIDERRTENRTEVTFQRDLSQWVLISLSELGTADKQNPGKHAEDMLEDKIQERRDLASRNDGEILQVKQDNLTCDDECCSIHAEILGSRMIELPPVRVFGQEDEPRLTLASFTEDVLIMSCEHRISELFAMRYSESDPHVDRFVRTVTGTFKQVK